MTPTTESRGPLSDVGLLDLVSVGTCVDASVCPVPTYGSDATRSTSRRDRTSPAVSTQRRSRGQPDACPETHREATPCMIPRGRGSGEIRVGSLYVSSSPATAPCVVEVRPVTTGAWEPGEILCNDLLGHKAYYRVVEAREDTVLVEVLDAPGLERGFQLAVTTAAASRMRIADLHETARLHASRRRFLPAGWINLKKRFLQRTSEANNKPEAR